MAISEQIINHMMKTINSTLDLSSATDVSLSYLLSGHPKTLEYILLITKYSSAVITSWIENIERGNWKNVSIVKYFTLYFKSITSCIKTGCKWLRI